MSDLLEIAVAAHGGWKRWQELKRLKAHVSVSGGLLQAKGAPCPLWALECGLAHGALAMSTPGDASMATLAEVLRAMSGSGRTER